MSQTQTADPGTPTPVPTPEQLDAMKVEARTLRAEKGWTLAELKRKYGAHFDTDWLEGIQAPSDHPTAGNGTTGKAKNGKAPPEAPQGPQTPAQPAQVSAPTGPPRKRVADDRPKAGAKRPTRRTESKATAARQSAQRARAAQQARDAKAKGETLDAPTGGDPSVEIAEQAPGSDGRFDQPTTPPTRGGKPARAGWMWNVPTGDVNFKGALEGANLDELRAGLAELAGIPHRKANRARIEARIRKLERAAQLQRATDAAAGARPVTPPASRPDARRASGGKPKGTGTGVSGRTLGYKAPLPDDAVRFIRRRYQETGGKQRAAIATEVATNFGVACNPMTVHKIGTRVSRAGVPDQAPKPNGKPNGKPKS